MFKYDIYKYVLNDSFLRFSGSHDSATSLAALQWKTPKALCTISFGILLNDACSIWLCGSRVVWWPSVQRWNVINFLPNPNTELEFKRSLPQQRTDRIVNLTLSFIFLVRAQRVFEHNVCCLLCSILAPTPFVPSLTSALVQSLSLLTQLLSFKSNLR